MTESAHADVARRLLLEVWGQGNLGLLPELVSDDITAHVAVAGAPLQGLAAYRELIAAYHGLYGPIRFSIDDQLEDGDRVATRWTAYLEAGQSLVPELAGEAREVMGMSIARFADGRVASCWDTWDSLAALQGGDGADVLQRLSFSL